MKGVSKPFPATDPDDLWWIRSGMTLFHPVAQSKDRFYSPFGYEDPLGSQTKVRFYREASPACYWLLLEATEDAHGNTAQVLEYEFRTLTPRRMQDANNNEIAALSDELGLVVLTAMIGKGNGVNRTGDSLAGANPYLTQAETDVFFANPIPQAPNYIHKATTRLLYDFNKTPARVATIAREIHVNSTGGNNSLLQISIEYTGGLGQVLLKKVQAERGDAWHVSRNAAGKCTPVIVQNISPRWVGNGRTILNNKGNPVKQYEPYFSDTHEYEDEDCVRMLGVTPILHYDPVGRVIRSDFPDESYSKTEFNPWEQIIFDQNDTLEPGNPWLTKKQAGSAEEIDAAQKALAHAGTPSRIYLDALSRPFFSIADNDNNQWYATWVDMDIEGNQRKVADARGNIVMAWKYDMLGRQVYQDSMDGGERWMFNDCMSKPLYKWDDRLQLFHFQYDDLHRPLKSYVKSLTQANQSTPPTGANGRCFDKRTYGDYKGMSANARQTAQTNNLIGQLVLQQDTAGSISFTRYDVKGNLEQSGRKILVDYQTPVNWDLALIQQGTPFNTTTKYDALGRPVTMTTPHGTGVAASEIRIEYNAAGLLEKVKAKVRGNPLKTYVSDINYNEKGQRTKIQYGNGVSTIYSYEKDTFRLSELHTIRTLGNKDLQFLRYTYDPVGNITSIQDNAQDDVYFAQQVVKAHGNYTYDAMYRLIEATGRELAENTAPGPYDEHKKVEFANGIRNNGNAMRNYRQSYEYDEVGNMLKMIHKAGVNNFTNRWTRSFEYNNDNAHRVANGVLANVRKNNRLLNEYIGARPAGAVPKYTYDLHGSMKQMPHLQLMDWNAKDELSHIRIAPGPENQSSQEAWYQYDASGQRTRKIVIKNGIKTERLYLGGFELYREYDANDNISLERESLHLMDDQQRIALIETKNLSTGPPTHDSPEAVGTILSRYQFSNHLGSAILELNDDAKEITYEEYYPYGSTAYQAKNTVIKAAAKRYRYTGMERDEESGLEYHSARYYAGWLGRWTAVDTIGVGDGLNVYLYASNNPIYYSDSFGTTSIPGQTGASNSPTAQEEQEKRSSTVAPDRVRQDLWTTIPADILGKLKDAGPGVFTFPSFRHIGGKDYRSDWVLVKKEDGSVNGFQSYPSETDLIQIIGNEDIARDRAAFFRMKERDILRYLEMGYNINDAADLFRADQEFIFKSMIQGWGDVFAGAAVPQKLGDFHFVKPKGKEHFLADNDFLVGAVNGDKNALEFIKNNKIYVTPEVMYEFLLKYNGNSKERMALLQKFSNNIEVLESTIIDQLSKSPLFKKVYDIMIKNKKGTTDSALHGLAKASDMPLLTRDSKAVNTANNTGKLDVPNILFDKHKKP